MSHTRSHPRRRMAEAFELLSSMRFAISLLVIISIAAVVGTVLKQNEPMPNYVNQFGPFWYEVFARLGLYAVYSTWWFLLIMAFLVVSTSLCIARTTPKMLRDMRSWREHVREDSLRNFHHRHEWTVSLAPDVLARQTAQRLADAGYGTRIVDKGDATLVSAKQGAGSKFGYLFAHSAIVIICVGGLLDSDLPVRFQKWFLGKTEFAGSGLVKDIPQQHRLPVSNPTYRGNTRIAEGQASDVAMLAQPNGVLLQQLPFSLRLDKFHIDFYSTGMPKLFASDVTVKDNETGHTFSSTIKVNHPLVYKGIAVYQSGFEDGGTRVKLTGFPMAGASATPFAIAGEVHGSTALPRAGEAYTVEWTDFRPFNVEDMAGGDPRSVAKGESLNQQLARTLGQASGSAARPDANKDLKNVGPSVQYKLRDKTGQAREYLNYMQPVTLDGTMVFLSGVRENPSDNFQFLRIPVDDSYSVREWMRLRAALADPALRAQAGRRYAQRALPAGASAELAGQLAQSAHHGLDVFAGADGSQGGFMGVMRFLDRLPENERENAAAIYMKILNGSMWELWQTARERDGLAPVEPDQKHAQFLQLSTNALADSVFYGAPVYLQLDEFEEVKASVLQVTRSPGKAVVYLGCLLLTLGVFAMFYIRERRIWVWLRPAKGGTHALLVMSTQRRTLDFEKEFNDMKAKLPQAA